MIKDGLVNIDDISVLKEAEQFKSTNACGAPSSAVKHEVSNPSSRVLGS